MMKAKNCVRAVLSTCLCTWAVADEVRWTNVNSGLQDWATASNWQGATDYPSGASDAAVLPDEPAATGNGSAVQTVRLPAVSAFEIGSVAGTWLHRITTYDRAGASVTPRTVTVGDTSGFDGVWMGNALKWSLFLSGAATSPRLSAIDAANRPTVNVPTGVTATLDAVTGASGYLIKEGAGSLLVRGTLNADAQRIDVNGGVLELEGAPDSLDAPGGDPVFWVDAARTNRMDLAESADGRTYVSAWRDAREEHESIVATALGGADGVYRPFLSAQMLGGIPVVDFGAYGWDSTYPADSSQGPSAGMTYDLGDNRVRNVILVFADTQVARAFPIGQTNAYQFHRGADNALTCDWTDAKVRNGILYLDGAEAEYGQAVPFGRFHILEYALTGEGLKPSTFAIDRDSRIGGVRLAEAIFYTNRLTHAERTATLRYLRRKWGDSGHKVGSDVNVLATADAAVSVSVPDGRTAKVRQLAVGGSKLVKKGGGTLKVGRFSPESPTLEIHGGAVAFDEKATAVSSAGPAEGAIFWGDATIDSFVSEDGAIVTWKDRRAEVTACAQVQVGHPTLMENALNGRRVLDFGTGPGGTGGTASWMKVVNLAGGDYPVREAVQLIRITNDTNYRPNLFGCQSQVLNRERKDVSSLLHPSYAYGKASAGVWTMNGVAVDPWARFDIDTNAYYVASFSSADAVGAHWLATDRGYEYGDTQLGEVLLYDRVLSDAERQQTIAYLMKKWKGVDAPFARAPARISRMEFSKDNAVPKLVADTDTTIGEVVLPAGGTLTKTGSGMVTVETPVRGVAALDVAGGALELAGGLTPAAFDAAAFHLDASQKSSFAWREGQEDDGRIARWYDCRGNGKYAATPFLAAGDSSYRGGMTNALYAVSDGSAGLSAGLPYVDFGIHQDSLDNADSSGMYLYEASGARAQVPVREFHAVFRFSGKNSTPLGGESGPGAFALVPSGKNFGGYFANCTTAVSAPKMSDGSDWYTANAYRPDSSDATTQFIVYSVAFPEAVKAWNIAIDRNCGVGGLKLCELVIYTDGTNDTATAVAINRYLLKKWKGLGEGGDFGTQLPLAVSDGASLRIGGATQRFSVPTLTGGGSVDVGDVNGLARLDVSLAADSSLSPVRVKGRVTLADTVTLSVGIRSKKKPVPGTYLLFEADELVNAESVNWVYETTGLWTDARIYTFVRDGNKVYLEVQKKGFVFYVR